MKNVLEYLEHSAKKYPAKKAFADEKKSCTYEELLESARICASEFVKYVNPRMPIPVLAEKSVDTMIVFMGIVYAGCFYILLDPKLPAARLSQILDTLEAEVLLVGEEYTKDLDKLKFTGKVLYMEDVMNGNVNEDTLAAIRSQALDIDPLYTNFTSGSTGEPKGVVVSHRSVIDFIDCFTELFDISHQDILGNQAPFDFDVSVKDIYSSLKMGATVEIIPRKLFSFPTKLLDYLCEKNITVLIWAVSALCMVTTLKGFDYKVPDKIRRVIFSGEVMPIKHLNMWRAHIPTAVYVNVYGPTEVTCNCTYYRVEREFLPGETLPIGIPFPNEKVFLLDDNDVVINEANKKGEICVAGTALSLGYYNNPKQTAKAFQQNPANKKYMELIYRTGDLAYYNESGELCFASRKDFQIKHMGHRIELGEIETAMEQIVEISRACCVYEEKRNKIVAFYEGTADRKGILKGLNEILPAFMLPNVLKRVEKLPVTKNGKMDRKALLESLREEKR